LIEDNRGIEDSVIDYSQFKDKLNSANK